MRSKSMQRLAQLETSTRTAWEDAWNAVLDAHDRELSIERQERFEILCDGLADESADQAVVADLEALCKGYPTDTLEAWFNRYVESWDALKDEELTFWPSDVAEPPVEPAGLWEHLEDAEERAREDGDDTLELAAVYGLLILALARTFRDAPPGDPMSDRQPHELINIERT